MYGNLHVDVVVCDCRRFLYFLYVMYIIIIIIIFFYYVGHTLLHLNQSKLEYIGIDNKDHRYNCSFQKYAKI